MTARPERLVLVTGGFHSGKSGFALKYAEGRGDAGLYVATSPLSDSDTLNRVAAQREERRQKGWSTLEVETDLMSALAKASPDQTVMIDCLTYWINRILIEAAKEEVLPDEDGMARVAERFVDAVLARPGLTVAVTNELGLSLSPDNDLARRFRVLVGRVNQVVADKADAVYFVVAGQSMRVK